MRKRWKVQISAGRSLKTLFQVFIKTCAKIMKVALKICPTYVLPSPSKGHRYFYSNKSQESQWLPPTWMDYYCPEYKCIYYYNTKTHESQWERPNDFVEEAIPELPKEDDKEFELSAQDNGNEQDGNFIFSRPPSRASYPKSAPATPRGRIPCDIAMSCLSPSARAGSPNLLSKRPRLPPPVGYRGQDQDESQPRVKRGNFFYEKQNDMIMMEEFQEETNDMMDVEKYHPNPMA